MSTSLYWMPPPEEVKGHSVYHLKWALAKRFGQYDGSCGEDLGQHGPELIPFLEGVISADPDSEQSKDAQELIDAIKKHGEICLYIQ
jgi:hypothetical protein